MRNRYVLPVLVLLLALAVPAAAQDAPAYRVGDTVQVSWQGTWFPATILEVGSGAQKGTYKVRYTGYDSSWDEYVPPRRIAAAARPASGPSQSAGMERSGRTATDPVGRYVCQSFEAGQLHNQGEFVLSSGGSYRDPTYRTTGSWSLDAASGRLTFQGGSLANGARARLTTNAQGKTAVEFTWDGGATRWCYKQSR